VVVLVAAVVLAVAVAVAVGSCSVAMAVGAWPPTAPVLVVVRLSVVVCVPASFALVTGRKPVSGESRESVLGCCARVLGQADSSGLRVLWWVVTLAVRPVYDLVVLLVSLAV
jgi:hypothetical protein